MGQFKGKRKRGYFLTVRKKITVINSPTRTPSSKRRKVPSSYISPFKIYEIKTPSSKKQKQSSVYNKTPTSRRKLYDNAYSRGDDGFEFEDESVDMSSGDPDIDLLLSIIPEAIKQFDEEKKKAIMLFFNLLKCKKFPTDNIAFELFLDVVRWFSKSDTRTMRYSASTLEFFWIGRKLFGGRFVRFMSGLKNETDFLCGKQTISPLDSHINFAAPSENILRTINPLGQAFVEGCKPGVIESMLDLKAVHSEKNASFVLMFDGKKVRKGGDVDLLGCEDGLTLTDKKTAHLNQVTQFSTAISICKSVSADTKTVADTATLMKTRVYQTLKSCSTTLSEKLKLLREEKKKKSIFVNKMKQKAVKEQKKGAYDYAIDYGRTMLYKIENCISSALQVQWYICKAGAALNGVEEMFASGKEVPVNFQRNVVLLDELKETMGIDILETRLVKQRSQEWFEARSQYKVTGSTIYAAVSQLRTRPATQNIAL